MALVIAVVRRFGLVWVSDLVFYIFVEVQTRQSKLGDTTDGGTAMVDFRIFPYRPLDDLVTEAE